MAAGEPVYDLQTPTMLQGRRRRETTEKHGGGPPETRSIIQQTGIKTWFQGSGS